MRKILISGGNGNIAKSLVDRLCDDFFVLLGRNKEELETLYSGYKNVSCFSYEDLFNDENLIDDVELFLHCAFERSENTKNLVKSLKLTSSLFQTVNRSNIKSIVNVSSMSAYSFKTEKVGYEYNDPDPTNFYGLAKVASEILLDSLCPDKNITNIRLAALSGSIYEKHVLTRFVKDAITKKKIDIVGGSQQFCFMDTKDAIEALCTLIESDPTNWKKVYNISDNTQYNIVYIANKVIEILKNDYKIKAKLKFKKTKDFYFNFSLNSDTFMKEFNWYPKYTLNDTIVEIIESFIQV